MAHGLARVNSDDRSFGDDAQYGPQNYNADLNLAPPGAAYDGRETARPCSTGADTPRVSLAFPAHIAVVSVCGS